MPRGQLQRPSRPGLLQASYSAGLQSGMLARTRAPSTQLDRDAHGRSGIAPSQRRRGRPDNEPTWPIRPERPPATKAPSDPPSSARVAIVTRRAGTPPGTRRLTSPPRSHAGTLLTISAMPRRAAPGMNIVPHGGRTPQISGPPSAHARVALSVADLFQSEVQAVDARHLWEKTGMIAARHRRYNSSAS